MAASLEAKMATKTYVQVVTCCDCFGQNPNKRICLSLFWFKICSRGEKREMKNEFWLFWFDDASCHL